MTTFRAYRIFSDAGRINGRLVDASLDQLTPGSVVVRVEWSSVNYKDALAATGAGKILRSFPLIGGIDLAGTVVSSDDPRFAPGAPVLATSFDLGVAIDGGYAEYARVPADWVVPIPDGLSAYESMAIGTAGFTAALSILEMERNGLEPGRGPIIVTGATGGVGCMAVQSLAAAGYAVTALTGKADQADLLRAIGAREVLLRTDLEMGTRPLEKAVWAGAIDAVGGDVLAWLTRTTAYGGVIACSGLTAGTELHTTVLPFILRAVKLLGIDSAMCPMPVRRDVWRRLGRDLKPRHLARVTTEIALDDLPRAFDTLLRGQARGRFVVRVS